MDSSWLKHSGFSFPSRKIWEQLLMCSWKHSSVCSLKCLLASYRGKIFGFLQTLSFMGVWGALRHWRRKKLTEVLVGNGVRPPGGEGCGCICTFGCLGVWEKEAAVAACHGSPEGADLLQPSQWDNLLPQLLRETGLGSTSSKETTTWGSILWYFQLGHKVVES